MNPGSPGFKKTWIACLSLAASLLVGSQAAAQTDYYWNVAGGGGSSTWDTGTQNWTTTAVGGVNDYTWTNSGSERANFGSGAGTVTLVTGISAYGLNFTTTGYTVTSNTLTLAGPGGVIDTGGVNATVNSIIAGSVGLTKTSGGTLSLGALNTYSGVTTVNGGVLSINASTRISANSGNIVINGGTLRNTDNNVNGTFMSTTHPIVIGSVGGATTGTIDVPTSGAVLTYAPTSSATLITSANGAGTGTITKSGVGTFRLSTSATAATLLNVQKVVVKGGLWQAGVDGCFGAAPGSPLSDAITLDGGGISANAGVTLTANRGITVDAGGGTLNASSNLTINGTITGVGNITKTGANSVTITGASSYSGSTSVTAGSLTAGAANSLSSSSAFTLSNTSGVVLNLNGLSQVIGSLTGGGTTGGGVTLGAGTLTTGGDNTSTTYAGGISGAGGGLTKTGNGTMILTGTNTYTGTTTISGGNLQVGNGGATGTLGSGAITNNSGLTFNRTAAITVSAVISGNGTLAQAGSGALTLSGVNTYSGTTIVVTGSTLAISGSGSINNSATISVGPTAILDASSATAGLPIGPGQTLSGSGTVVGNSSIANGGTLAPGDTSPGTLLIGAGTHNWSPGGTYDFRYDQGAKLPGPVQGGNNDLLQSAATGTTLDLSSLSAAQQFNLDLIPFPGTPQGGPVTYTIADFSPSIATTKINLPPSIVGSDLTPFFHFSGSYIGTPSATLAGGGSEVQVTFTPIPEPSSLALVCGGVAGLVAWRRRKRKVEG